MAHSSPSANAVSLLSEFGCSTAAELILGVAYQTAPLGPTFIPELDEHILSARPHAGGSSLLRGDLVEIIGPSGSGKSTILAFLLMTTLLPASFELPISYPHGITVKLGGRGKCATLLAPPSHRSLIPLLERSLKAHIGQCIAAALEASGFLEISSGMPVVQDAIERISRQSLARLSVLRPRARAQTWTASLRRLLHPPELMLGGALPAFTPELVVCDGFGDGFWPERWAAETRKEDAGMKDVMDAITALRRERGAVVVLSVQGLRPIANTPFFKPHLPAPYPSLDTPTAWGVNVQITLSGPSRALQFPPETTLVEALRAQERGAQVCSAVVRVPGGKGPALTASGARWSFAVTDAGLVPFIK